MTELEKSFEELDKYINSKSDAEKHYMLFNLLRDFKKECYDYAKDENNSDNSRIVANDGYEKCESLETLLCYHIW